MDYNENLQSLRKLMHFDSKINHSFNDEFTLLPFQTRTPNRPNYKDFGFVKIIAEFSRFLFDKEWDKDLSLDNLMANLKDKVDYDIDDEKYLRAIINDYLFNDSQELSIVHPCLFLYVPESTKKSKTGEIEVAKFFRDVMFSKFPQIKDYFSYSIDDDISKQNALVRLVLENLPELNDKKTSSIYYPKLNYVLDIFWDDMSFALEHEDFFNKNLEDLFAYYYFFYISQLCLKLSMPGEYKSVESIEEIEKLYYLVDSESATRTRETIDRGFGLIKEKNNKLIDKIYLIDYVNKLLGTKGLLLQELKTEVDSLNNSDYNSFISNFKLFLEEYMEIMNIEDNFKVDDDFDNLCSILFKCLNKKDPAIGGRYAKSLSDLADKYFLKNGGPHGKVLNINQNTLVAITALCIRDDKIKRNDLFKEYEKRGLFFDKKSKLEIDNILTKLDLIDKKSDSGDAQYVKRIL